MYKLLSKPFFAALIFIIFISVGCKDDNNTIVVPDKSHMVTVIFDIKNNSLNSNDTDSIKLRLSINRSSLIDSNNNMLFDSAFSLLIKDISPNLIVSKSVSINPDKEVLISSGSYVLPGHISGASGGYWNGESNVERYVLWTDWR